MYIPYDRFNPWFQEQHPLYVKALVQAREIELVHEGQTFLIFKWRGIQKYLINENGMHIADHMLVPLDELDIGELCNWFSQSCCNGLEYLPLELACSMFKKLVDRIPTLILQHQDDHITYRLPDAFLDIIKQNLEALHGIDLGRYHAFWRKMRRNRFKQYAITAMVDPGPKEMLEVFHEWTQRKGFWPQNGYATIWLIKNYHRFSNLITLGVCDYEGTLIGWSISVLHKPNQVHHLFKFTKPDYPQLSDFLLYRMISHWSEKVKNPLIYDGAMGYFENNQGLVKYKEKHSSFMPATKTGQFALFRSNDG